MTPVATLRRKGVRALGSAMAAILLLSGCGSSIGASDAEVARSNDDVTITLNWWGGDSRIKATEEVVENFENKYPDIHVNMQYADWTGYWDRLAVQSAGGNAPDVMQMDELYLSFYGSMGALFNLDETSQFLDLSTIDSELRELGKVDGTQVAAPLTTAQYGVIVNNDVLKSLNIELPDTDNWTWSEFEDIATEVNQRSNGEIIGAISPNNGFGLQVWARQHSESLFDGNTVAISPETLASFLDMPAQWAHNGISGNAERWSEDTTATLNDTDFGKGKQAFMLSQTSQITPYAQAAGGADMTLVPLPQVDPSIKSMYLKPGMYWAISSQTQHPAESAMLIDYLLNDPTAGDILGTERGIPANDSIRKSLARKASGTDRIALDFVDKIQPSLGKAPQITPSGASDLDTTIVRYQQNVVFGKQTALDAAKAMIAQLQESIDFAS